MKNEKYYYFIELEISKKKSDKVFGFINVSHISYNKLEEIFKEQITDERFLFDDSRGYDIDKELYLKFKTFFDQEISFRFDFQLFNYSVRLSSMNALEYKKNYHEQLPPHFTKSS